MRTQVRPTVFGLALALVVVVSAVVRPPVADPSATGLVWGGLLGALVLGVIWPIVTVRMVGVRVVAAPTDLVAGQLSSLELELTGRASGLSVGATGGASAVLDVVSPGVVRIPVVVARRGVYRRIRIDLGSDAPFAVVWVNRSRVVELPRDLLVGPVSEPVVATARELPGDVADPTPRGAGSTGEAVRSVRPYVTGDPSHLVHWPSTARVGSLVVRELEPPAARGLAVVVDLGDGTDGAGDHVEAAASRAAGVAESVLDHGGRVVLCTAEAGGPVTDEVGDVLGIRRRLARAVPGTPGAPPDHWPVEVVTPSPDRSVPQFAGISPETAGQNPRGGT